MPAVEPGKIRNVAVVGHRGTGKTSLVEAMLFQAGATNRLGVVEQGTTVSDWDEDEQEREMSISNSLTHLEWQGRKINLIDTPGEPSFQGDAIAALHVVEGALVTVSGVMGVEVQTSPELAPRRRPRPRTRRLREHARPRARRLLPDARAAAVAVRQPVRGHPPADRSRARADRHRRPPAHDRVHEPRGREGRQPRGDPGGDGERGRAVPDTAARLGRRDRRGAHGALPRRPGAVARRGRLGAEGRRHARRALPGRLRGRDEEPRHDGRPRPARRGRPVPGEEGRADRDRGRGRRGLRLQDRRRSVRGPHQHLPRPPGIDLVRRDAREREDPRQGAGRRAPDAPGQGARACRRVRRGRHRCRREAEGRDDRRRAPRLGPEDRPAEPRLPGARDELRDHARRRRATRRRSRRRCAG